MDTPVVSEAEAHRKAEDERTEKNMDSIRWRAAHVAIEIAESPSHLARVRLKAAWAAVHMSCECIGPDPAHSFTRAEPGA